MGGFANPGAGNGAIMGVHNNSLGPDLLVIHHFETSVLAANIVEYGLRQGTIGSANPVPSVPLVTGEKQLAGAPYFSSTVGVLTTDTTLFMAAGIPYLWPHEWPVAVLLPGWDFIITCGAVAVGIRGGILWETVSAELYWQQLEDLGL